MKSTCQHLQRTATRTSCRTKTAGVGAPRWHSEALGGRATTLARTSHVGTGAPEDKSRQSPGGFRAWLTDEIGRVYCIHQLIRLGRSRENDCPLPDRGVSRRHAAINRDSSGACWLLDLKSTNGTFLNAGRVEHNSLLRDGDRIRLGRFELVFHQPEISITHRSPTTLINGEDYHREHRWLLLADIEHATGFLLKNGTESYQARLSRWLGGCQRIVDHHYGSVHEFVGDGFFAWWPDAIGIEFQVVRALQALRAEEAAGLFAFRLVLHCGEVLVAGQASPHKAGLCGEAIHYLFRLEKVASRLNQRDLFSQEAGERLRLSLPELTPLDCEVPDFGSRGLFSAPPELWARETEGTTGGLVRTSPSR